MNSSQEASIKFSGILPKSKQL